MTSSETGHNYSYDLLRIIAILCVIFNHTRQYGYEHKLEYPTTQLLDFEVVTSSVIYL